MRKIHWIGVGLVAVTALTFLAIGISIGDCKNDYSYCQSENKYLAALTDIFPALFDFIGRNLSAIGTAVTAIFTGTLWWSTHRLWLGSENQTKITKGAHRGFLFPGKPAISLETVANKIPSGFHSVKIPVRHIGASPVIFTEIYWEFRDVEPTENVATYSGGATKLVDGAMDQNKRERIVGPFTTNTVDTQYIVGIIHYLDAWKEPHKSRFCFSIASNPDFIATSGSRAYNEWD